MGAHTPIKSTIIILVVTIFVATCAGTPQSTPTPGASPVPTVVASPSARATPRPTPRVTPAPTEAFAVPIDTAHRVRAIATGGDSACAIGDNGKLVCWSGVGIEPAAGSFVSVSTTWRNTCAIDTTGRLQCWGEAQDLAPDGSFSAVDLGGGSACAIRADGTLACWSLFCDPSQEEEEEVECDVTAPDAHTFAAISVNDSYGCGIRTEGQLACWSWIEEWAPSPPAGTFKVLDVRDPEQPCAISTAGHLTCWGAANASVLPVGTFTALTTIGPSDQNGGHACAIRTDGSMACWTAYRGAGNDWHEAIPLRGKFKAVSAGSGFNCAVRTDDTLACWGSNSAGQVRPVPSAYLTLPSVPGSTKIMVAWGATSFAPIASYEVHFAEFGQSGVGLDWYQDPSTTWLAETQATNAVFTGSPGKAYGFAVRAHDTDKVTSAWSEAEVRFPIDDRSLERTGAWTAIKGSSYYAGTALRTYSYGAIVAAGSCGSGEIQFLVTKCPSCGSVEIYQNSRLLSTLTLHAASRADRQLISIWSGDEGPVLLKVASRSQLVLVDGYVLP